MNARLSASAPVAVALALVLAGEAMVGTARADGAFGAYRQNQPVAAARSWWDGSTAYAHAPQSPTGSTAGSRVVSTVPTVDGRADIVGNHGPQDNLAKEIYRPGSRPIGW